MLLSSYSTAESDRVSYLLSRKPGLVSCMLFEHDINVIMHVFRLVHIVIVSGVCLSFGKRDYFSPSGMTCVLADAI